MWVYRAEVEQLSLEKEHLQESVEKLRGRCHEMEEQCVQHGRMHQRMKHRALGASGTRPKSVRGRENECGCICSNSSPSRASAGSTTSVCSQHNPPYCSTPTALTQQPAKQEQINR
ncbi:serologically defined colon cancer antigen 8 homolog isoform X1, partial [Tachysurus ichikawai]